MPAKITSSVEEYLLGKRVITENGCWEWPGSTRPNGYVNFWNDGKSHLLHRFAYALWVGEPGDLLVLHRCDNRKCYNPEDLFLGTDQENKDDMVAKGRSSIGSKNARSRLTDDDIQTIFAIRGLGFYQREIAVLFGVTQTLISQILLGKRWRHVLKPSCASTHRT